MSFVSCWYRSFTREIVYQCPSLDGIREYSKRELDTIWEEIKRFATHRNTMIDLTKDLLDLKLKLLNDHK